MADTPANTAKRARNLVWSVPVGLQLSLLYALLFATILALLGWALYGQLEGFLVQNTAERLDRLTRPQIVRTLPPRPGEYQGELSTAEQTAIQLVRELGRSQVVAVLAENGQVLDATENYEDYGLTQIPALLAGWTEQVAGGAAYQWIDATSGEERQLVVLTPLVVRGRDGSVLATLYLQQVTSLGAADAVLNQLRFYILLGIVVGTAIGVVAGLALTRVILRPLDRMVRAAEDIAAGDLDRRLHLPPGRNEVARLGSAFDHMVDRLGASLTAQRRFVADASHELRTPLTSLEGMSEMLLMGADQGDPNVVQRAARSMHGELRRLGRLVADLLTLSRLDNTTPVRLTQLDAGKLAVEVAEQMRPLAEAKEIHLATICPGPAPVNGEPDRLKQVMLNLVDNAIRHTPQGGEITVSAVDDPGRGEVRIEVRDTGPGIDPKDLPHIFDRFYRGDASRARATGNTGLGLAIARAIVEAHSGTIAAESGPGEGATFRVTLPGIRKHARREQPHAPQPQPQAQEQPAEEPTQEPAEEPQREPVAPGT
ncbi:MAG TPA: HAMP domain-containing sensor histidine kinase [Chloroflexia bacterium]|nr:HAMP domain-containing sensor histidine kinase [Chloroflexia bacterium]